MTEDQTAEKILKDHDDWIAAGGSHASPDVKRHMLRTRIADHLQAAYGRGVRETIVKMESATTRLPEQKRTNYGGTNSADLAAGVLIGQAIGGGVFIPAEAAPPVPLREPQPESPSPESSDRTDSTSQE